MKIFIKKNYLLSRLINAIFDNFARTGETQKKEGLPFLVAKSSTQQEVMTPSLYIVGYNNNVVFYLTEVVGKMCFRPRGVVPFDSYTDGGHTTSTTRAFSLCSAAFFRDILCIYMRSRTAACLVPTNATHRGHRAYLQQVYSVHNIK